jgi:hypothetical protein
MADLAGLNQRQRLEQLVQSAVATGEHHEPLGILHEHRLANEEVPEVDAEVDVLVHVLFERQLDVAPDRQAASVTAATIGRLHHPGSASGDDRQPGSGQLLTDLTGLFVQKVLWPDPGGPEHADGRGDRGQRVEALHELRQDPEHPPWVGIDERGISTLQEGEVFRRPRHPGGGDPASSRGWFLGHQRSFVSSVPEFVASPLRSPSSCAACASRCPTRNSSKML